MFITKINIESMNIDKIVFTLTPNIDNLQKSQLNFQINNNIFSNYDIKFTVNNSIKYYEIIPYNSFNVYNIIDFQITDVNYVSNMVKIIFCKYFEEGKAYIDFKFNGNYDGKYIFSIKNTNKIFYNISSEPLVISKPINSELSYIDVENYNNKLGDIIEVNIKLNKVDNLPVPDGLYEIEILDYK